MLDEFIEFTQALFPAISPYVKAQTKEAVRQFERTGKKLYFFTHKPYDFLAQGDILDGIPFTRIGSDGNISAQVAKGMIISNTCSADHDNEIVLAPLMNISQLGLEKTDIIKNRNCSASPMKR